jgi:hypothetical protein
VFVVALLLHFFTKLSHALESTLHFEQPIAEFFID